jgi:phosphatidyl-myo-inositol alpha-mannosyltransferase
VIDAGGTPLRIALFHSSLPRPGRKLGGVEVFVHRLGNRLTARGHEVTVFTFGVRPEDAYYRVIRAGDPRLGGRAARLTAAPLVLNRLDQSGYDVLHLHGDDWFFWRRRIPTVRTFHGSALYEARSATSVRRRSMQTVVFPLEVAASRLATLSFDVGSQLPRAYRAHGSLVNAVEQPALAKPTPRSAHPTILFVGTWGGRKRGSYLADCFAREVRPLHPTAELIMISDRCDTAPGVRFVAFPSDAALSELYGQSWAFCMPSTYEGFGMPYVEAMAHGLPVVATPNPGARHVLGENAGLIVDDPDLGRTLVRLLADPAERARLAKAGRQRSLAFTWDRVIDDHEAAYRLAIGRFDRRPR